MDLIKATEITSKCLENTFLSLKIEVEDYRNNIHTIVLHKDQVYI